MSSQLKDRIIVADPDGHFEMWTRQEYDEYVRGAVSVGAGAAYGIVTHFNEDERLLAPTSPANDMPTAFHKEPVTFLLSNALRYLTQDQQRQLCNALLERLPVPPSLEQEARRRAEEYASIKHEYTTSADYEREVKAHITAARQYMDTIDKLRAALEIIAKWELPATGRFWDIAEQEPMSYGACYGSNGERDYMKSIATSALKTTTHG